MCVARSRRAMQMPNAVSAAAAVLLPPHTTCSMHMYQADSHNQMRACTRVFAAALLEHDVNLTKAHVAAAASWFVCTVWRQALSFSACHALSSPSRRYGQLPGLLLVRQLMFVVQTPPPCVKSLHISHRYPHLIAASICGLLGAVAVPASATSPMPDSRQLLLLLLLPLLLLLVPLLLRCCTWVVTASALQHQQIGCKQRDSLVGQQRLK
jgi:hypothetical protein